MIEKAMVGKKVENGVQRLGRRQAGELCVKLLASPIHAAAKPWRLRSGPKQI